MVRHVDSRNACTDDRSAAHPPAGSCLRLNSADTLLKTTPLLVTAALLMRNRSTVKSDIAGEVDVGRKASNRGATMRKNLESVKVRSVKYCPLIWHRKRHQFYGVLASSPRSFCASHDSIGERKMWRQWKKSRFVGRETARRLGWLHALNAGRQSAKL